MFSVKFKSPNKKALEFIGTKAVQAFGCNSILEDQLEEVDVDELLGDKSFCGGEVPLDVLAKLESAQLTFPECFFEDDKSAKEFQVWLLSEMGLDSSFVELVEKDWNQEWKKHYETISFEDKFFIVPEWLTPPTSKAPYILLNPGLGFGTGTHPTTYGCIKTILNQAHLFENKKNVVLDLGCGSGILGIAFLKLFNGSVDFCDIDTDALSNCEENLKINKVIENASKKFSIIPRSKAKPAKYSLVFANILLNVLLSEAIFIKSVTDENSLIIFSGILKDQKIELINAYKKLFNFEIIQEIEIKDWVSLAIRRIK